MFLDPAGPCGPSAGYDILLPPRYPFRAKILPEKPVSGHNLIGAEQSAIVGDSLLIALSVVKR
jgi:hypothetical protein